MKLLKTLIILLGTIAVIFGLLILFVANWSDTPAKYQATLIYGYLALGTITVFSGILLKSNMSKILFAGIFSIVLVIYPFIFEKADFSDKMVIFGLPLMAEVVILFLLNDARRSIKLDS